MTPRSRGGLLLGARLLAVLALASGAAASRAAAQSAEPCDLYGPMPTFPRIPICAFAGGYRDSTLLDRTKCVGIFQGPLPDSVDNRPRTVTVRFRRDRRAEARRDFGGYRLYRVINSPDSTKMMLLRRFSKQVGDERTWNFSSVRPDTTRNPSGVVTSITFPFVCRNEVVHDSVVTFVDPDSNGNWEKVCKLRIPRDDINGRCDSPGDSIFVLRAPPGPHDGFRTWYAITYEAKNTSLDGNYADMFVPNRAQCTNPNDSTTCTNLNHKLANITEEAVEPTAGPTSNLERVGVVPNPYRAREAWEAPGASEMHFTNLPRDARIRIYTVSGDLVMEIHHTDPIRDFERWNLKNQNGKDIASGIYMFRVESSQFQFQDRFVVIR